MIKMRDLFERTVSCAKVMSHITNKEVRLHLANISNYSRIAHKAGDGYMHLSMVLASRQSVAVSCRFLARYFKSHGLHEISKSYWSDWSYWMGLSRATKQRIEDYERQNVRASAAQAINSCDSDGIGGVGLSVQTSQGSLR